MGEGNRPTEYYIEASENDAGTVRTEDGRYFVKVDNIGEAKLYKPLGADMTVAAIIRMVVYRYRHLLVHSYSIDDLFYVFDELYEQEVCDYYNSDYTSIQACADCPYRGNRTCATKHRDYQLIDHMRRISYFLETMRAKECASSDVG